MIPTADRAERDANTGLPSSVTDPLGVGSRRVPQYDSPIGPGIGGTTPSTAPRPPQYDSPIGPSASVPAPATQQTYQYALTPDGRIVVVDGSGQPASGSWWQAVGNATANYAQYGMQDPATFNPSTAGSFGPQGRYGPPENMYKAFEMLTPQEKNFWALMAANYDSNSNPETQYAKFVEIAYNQGQQTGIYANAMGIAMRHARDMGYDMRNAYVPGDRASMAMRRGTASFDQGAYDPDFEGFGSGLDTSSGGYSGYGGGSYGGGGGGSATIQLTNPTSARGLLMQTMQSVLGRNPTNQEYRDFLTTLNEYETASPKTVTVDGDTAVYEGGVDPSVIAMDFTKNAEDYKSSQARGYFNTMMQALGGAANG